VIGATTLDELLQADPHNVVRLILPRSAPHDVGRGDVDPNQEAAERLRSWLDASILAADPEPSLYVYEQSSPEGAEPGWQQRGLIALVKIGAPEVTGIVPHEDVMPGPVRDRRDLMAATRANLEPIFLVYQGGSSVTSAAEAHGGSGAGRASVTAGPGAGSVATALTDEVAARRPPLVTAVTPDGIRHRLWRLADPGEHAAVAADLATRSALIADGHHRYAAYRELQEMMPGSGPWDYGLAFLVDADAYPPRLGAIHRVIPGLSADHAARLAAKASFTVTRLDASDLDQAVECLALAGDQGPAFLLAGLPGTASGRDSAASGPSYWLVTDPDPEVVDAAMPAGASPAWRRLDAAILQRVLLGHGWGIEDSERSVLVFHDAREATTAAVAAEGVAVVMGAVPFGIVRDIALLGERVPRKSTSFGPKPRSGLVLRGFDT
jgi:uncharacterized protein (DUF1015 family)